MGFMLLKNESSIYRYSRGPVMECARKPRFMAQVGSVSTDIHKRDFRIRKVIDMKNTASSNCRRSNRPGRLEIPRYIACAAPMLPIITCNSLSIWSFCTCGGVIIPGLKQPLDGLNYKGFSDLPDGGGVFMKNLGFDLLLYLWIMPNYLPL
jgi:hypothetical protein